MNFRLIGAGILFLSSVYVGFSAASSVRKTAKDLQQLKLALEMIRCEVSYAHTPIGTVCNIISRSAAGDVGRFFRLAYENYAKTDTLPEQWVPSLISSCFQKLPISVQEAMAELLASFGKFGTQEQLRLIDLTAEKVDTALAEVNENRAQRCKCYRTLGVCTGLAVAVLVL